MDILLVTATSMEMHAVLAGLPHTSVLKVDKAPVVTADIPRVLECGPWKIYPLVCGVGPINAAFALGRYLGDFSSAGVHCDGVVNMGLAGSYDTSVAPVGSIVAASMEVWPEYGLADVEGVQPEALGFPLAERQGNPIFDRIGLSPESALTKLGFHSKGIDATGISVTVAGCSANPRQAARIRERTLGLTENMEGFSLALGCLRYEAGYSAAGEPEANGSRELLFVELRAISNEAGYRPPDSWDIPSALKALGRTASSLFVAL